MKKIILTGAVLLSSILVNAQAIPTPNQSQEIVTGLDKEVENKQDDVNQSQKKVKRSAEERATFQTEQVKTACGDISAEQEAKIKAIFLDRANKVDALKSNAGGKKKEEIQPLFAKSNEELKAILTPEQLEKLKSFRKDKRKSNQENGGKGGNGKKNKKNK